MLQSRIRCQRGSVLPVAVIFLPVLLLGLAILWDWSRVQIQWRGLQTATDAAALSGAMSGERWSQLYITRYWTHIIVCCGKKGCWICHHHNHYNDIPVMRGRDKDLFDRGGWGPNGWKTRANCGSYNYCNARIDDRWIIYNRGQVTKMAEAAFQANANAMGASSQGFAWSVQRVETRDNIGPVFDARMEREWEDSTVIWENVMWNDSNRPPQPGWCSRVMEEDTVRVEASGTTTFDLLPSFGGLTAQDYQAKSEARGWWPGVTSPPHPPDRPDVWRGTWDRVCR